MSNSYTRDFHAAPEQIDELGHVNNAVWVRWVQDIATEHWRAAADPAMVDRYFWVVVRHEIDYRGNVGAGATVRGRTYIPGTPKGAKFDRCVEFRDEDGKLLVAVRSTWAMIDRESGRPARITEEVAGPFIGTG